MTGWMAAAATVMVLAAPMIEGTDLGDFLVGTAGPDQVLAKGGDDTVYGLGEADRLDRGPGNDRLHGDGTCAPKAERPEQCSDDDDRTGAADVLHGGDG